MKKIKPSEAGSALLVTIFMTGIVLLFAVILLERIIPYAQQVQWMENALQAYYTARGEVERARYNFTKEWTRNNIDTRPSRIPSGTSEVIDIKFPNLSVSGKKFSEFVVISTNSELPLKIKLFENDDEARGFGTSQKNQNFHHLSTYDNSILFDLSRRDTSYWYVAWVSGISLSMITKTDEDNKNTAADIGINFLLVDSGVNIPFFGTVSGGKFQGKNIWAAENPNNKPSENTLSKILGSAVSCEIANCSLGLRLIPTSPTISSIPVSFSVSTAIPDLNAVIIADGISEKGDYHARIIDLIPLTQSI